MSAISKSNRAVSDRINDIRNQARASMGEGPMTECPTCTRPADAPYRVYGGAAERHRVIQGCVDSFHTGHLVPSSESNFWQNSTGAEKIRRRELDSLIGMDATKALCGAPVGRYTCGLKVGHASRDHKANLTKEDGERIFGGKKARVR